MEISGGKNAPVSGCRKEGKDRVRGDSVVKVGPEKPLHT